MSWDIVIGPRAAQMSWAWEQGSVGYLPPVMRHHGTSEPHASRALGHPERGPGLETVRSGHAMGVRR